MIYEIVLEHKFNSMKKIVNIELGYFNKKDLINYSKIVNRYFKKRWRFIFVFLCISCSVQEEMCKDDFKKIPKNFSASFCDKLDSIGIYDNKVITRSLLKGFTNIETIDYSKPIQLKIQENELYLKFEDFNSKQYVLKFYGKRYRDKFVFYINYKTISFPFILMSKEMERYKIYLTSKNELLLSQYYENEGMLLFFGAASTSGFDYQFKLLKNE